WLYQEEVDCWEIPFFDAVMMFPLHVAPLRGFQMSDATDLTCDSGLNKKKTAGVRRFFKNQ
ncbi:MAG: hypothetical protein K0U32_06005, partial [Betaproteobacteria bacterium]|nr:hypothetical protein [Betaproteobacteria bacterium]